MSARNAIRFGPYRLDQDNVRLWKGSKAVPLQPRPLAVLSYLAARPGEVVERDELLARVWEGSHVTRAVLKVAVRALREALDDAADAPRYIETVGQIGYRFIGAGAAAAPAAAAAAAVSVAPLIGRQGELAVLQQALIEAGNGVRQLVVLSGEAGIGKTTLVDHFTDAAGAAPDVVVARGQCLEQYGESEAYLPVLDALGRLTREPGGQPLIPILRRSAPTWAGQLPGLATPQEAARRDDARTPAPTRMVRELSAALDAFCAQRTLVLALEDLQWSDPSTVELLGALARGRGTARLLLLATVRGAELIVRDHPLRALLQTLRASGHCTPLVLELLTSEAVTAYITTRCPGIPATALRRIAARIHERTEGNALFMVNMVNDLVASGLLVARDGRWRVEGSIDAASERVPVGLRELIGHRLQGLAASERRTLEAASVAGDTFAVASLAAALRLDPAAIEAECGRLATRESMIVAAGTTTWPDGTTTARYRFLHALYRQVLYDGISAARRVHLHQAIGEREMIGLGELAAAQAAQLAMHFGRGRDWARAVEFHRIAARGALERQASHEVVAHCSAALEALAQVPVDAAQREQELRLVATRARLSMAIHGYAAAETVQDYARARVLCAELPTSPTLYPVLRGLLSYHHVRAELDDAHQLGVQLLEQAERQRDDHALRVQAHYGHGATLFHQGALEETARHLEAGGRDYDPAAHATHARVYGGYDPGVACRLWLAWTRGFQGRMAEGAELAREGLALARQLPDPFTLAWACQGAGVWHQLCGEWLVSESLSVEGAQLAEQHGFPHVLGSATINRGWALVMLGRADLGIPMVREGVATIEATGARLMRPSYLGMLAAADILAGDRMLAAERFDSALAELAQTGERLHEASLLIGKSRLLAGGGPGGRTTRALLDEAEALLRQALASARGQGARLVELRAAVALARHCRKLGREAEGLELVREVHEWFAEAPAAAPEITAARALLDG
jgi:DNA-binding winged helix-turn-helix (wHTH) protein/predicted ATPase